MFLSDSFSKGEILFYRFLFLLDPSFFLYWSPSTFFLSQIINFLTPISDCDALSPALLDLLLASEPSLIFILQCLLLHRQILVLLSLFPFTLLLAQSGMYFCCAAFGYIYANWDVPRKDIFNMGVLVLPLNLVSDFRLGLMS